MFFVSAEESFVDAFRTPKGSVIGNYSYGTLSHKLLHRPLNTDFIIDAKRAAKDACAFDPRLIFERADINTSSFLKGKVQIDVYANIGNLISLEMSV